MRSWSDRFIPESLYGDAAALSRARLMVQLSAVMIATAAPYAVVFATFVPFRTGAAILAVGACLAPVALGVLRVTPRLHVAGHTLTTVLYGVVVALMCVQGGLASLATPWLAMPPIFAILLLGRRGLWEWTTISVLTVLGFFLVEARGVRFPVDYPAAWTTQISVAIYAGFVVCIASLVFVFENIRAGAQAHAELASEALAQLAYFDALTGLANRSRFLDRLQRSLNRAQVDGEPGRIVVLLLDLDGFKAVNDSLGHAAGDAVLTEVAARLLNATRGRDTVARLGGDEFAVLVDGIHDDGDIIVVAERIVTALGLPFMLHGQRASIGASVGIARAESIPDGGDRPTGAPHPSSSFAGSKDTSAAASLLHEADVALYQAKALGKGRWVRFERATLAAAAAD